MWTARYWWKAKYKVDPPILSADQMPLHRNESSGQKSLNFSGRDQSCFVKENHHLSRERCTVMTIASSSNQLKTPSLEFVFKGKGKRVNPPDKVTIQWTEKGSYRLENVLKYVESLPSIPVMITLALDGSEDHLASRKLMDLIGKEMLEFRENLLSSKPAATLKELRAQIIKPEGVQMKGQTAKDKAPPREGLELVDGDGEDLDVDYIQDLEDDSQENKEGTDGDEQGTNYENTNLVENLECEDDNMPTSNNTEVMNTKDLQLLQKINDTICHVKKECSNTLLSFFCSNRRGNSHC